MESIEAHNARIERMVTEHATLQVRINVAKNFVAGPVFATISATEQSLLVSQIMAMDTYATILALRLDLATD